MSASQETNRREGKEASEGRQKEREQKKEQAKERRDRGRHDAINDGLVHAQPVVHYAELHGLFPLAFSEVLHRFGGTNDRP